MSQEPQKKLSIEEFITIKRQNLILILENSKEQSLKTFDDLTNIIAQQQNQIKDITAKLPKEPKQSEPAEESNNSKPVIKIDTKGKKK